MNISSTALLVAALVSCTVTEVWSFVQPAGVNAWESLPAAARRRGAAPAPAGGGSRAAVVCLSSSPFEGVERDGSGGEDEVDLVQREAEQLEELIRGSRGVVVEAIEREWREEMLRVLGEEGERLCSEAYEGYLDRGRGAIFVSPPVFVAETADSVGSLMFPGGWFGWFLDILAAVTGASCVPTSPSGDRKR